MKPDWKDAPEWAQYLAMDEEGDWYWYEQEPYVDFDMWCTNAGEMQPAYATDWTESLEQRP